MRQPPKPDRQTCPFCIVLHLKVCNFAGISNCQTAVTEPLYLVVSVLGGTNTVVGGLEEPICPPLKTVTDVDRDAAFNGIQGRPVLGHRDCIPDVANPMQVWILLHILAWCNFKAAVPCKDFHTFILGTMPVLIAYGKNGAIGTICICPSLDRAICWT